MAAAFVAYLHYLSIFALFALLSIEHVLFKAPLDLSRARSLMLTDLAYGICAVLVLATGIARMLWFGKGTAYYMSNSLFHAKVGLFILVGVLSILPTLVFIKWRKTVKAGQVPEPSVQQVHLVTWSIRLELLALLFIPLLATLMARGYGVIAAG
jgi:putative membrane protein